MDNSKQHIKKENPSIQDIPFVLCGHIERSRIFFFVHHHAYGENKRPHRIDGHVHHGQGVQGKPCIRS